VNLSDLDYELPIELIAQEPLARRDRCRLLVLDRSTGEIEHTRFHRLPEYLEPRDLVVLNDTRVIRARLYGVREATGGKAEVLLVESEGEGRWRLMATARGKLRPGEVLKLEGGRIEAHLVRRDDEGLWQARLEPSPDERVLSAIGTVPLPPYIKRAPHDPREKRDAAGYQTVFADEPGAVAAPTAGLHFTRKLLDEIARRGVGIERLTLHVGPGTFTPIRAEKLDDHRMHSEKYRVAAATLDAVRETRGRGGRVVAVGTTVVRTLETVIRGAPLEGKTRLFIRPPFRFEAVDALVTNFHLPRSTLLALVVAFGTREKVMEAYREAIRERYRFYSYGDAMLIL